MDKRQVAGVLEEIGVLLEILGENPFKTRAYENAARALQSLDRDLGELVREEQLHTVRGIGKGIAEKVSTLVTTGELPYYEDLKGKVPAGLLELMRIPGLGPKRVKEIHDELQVASLGDLEQAIQSGKLAALPGFGEKMQEKVLQGIEAVRRHGERHLLSEALAEGERLRDLVAAFPEVKRCQLAGSVRRFAETVGDLDLVASSTKPTKVMDRFVALDGVEDVIAHGETKTSVHLTSGIQVDLRVVKDVEFPYTLHHFTGSKEHNVAMRGRAQEMGLKINEYGLWKGSKRIPCKDEEAFFEALGLHFIPPELREDRGEIEAAEQGPLPRLLECDDLRGLIHVHCTFSDGANTLREMVLAARERGYEWIAMTDHSQSARYANGMQPGDVRRYWKEIDALQDELDDLRIFKGTECDILPDGTLDYPDEMLAGFDLVVGSVHSRFGMSRKEMTERVLRALESPYLDVLGHPTGRLLLEREAYQIDLEAIVDRAAERGTAIEINANPRRLDLDWRMVKRFREQGGWVSIDPDAHRIEGLDDVRYGVAIARKGWVTPERVLNLLSAEELAEWLGGRRTGVAQQAKRRRTSRKTKTAARKQSTRPRRRGGTR